MFLPDQVIRATSKCGHRLDFFSMPTIMEDDVLHPEIAHS